MSNSRSDRRRQSRGGSAFRRRAATRCSRSTSARAMLMVIVIAVFLVLALAATERVTQAYATPTPAAIGAGRHDGKPIQLADGETIGKAADSSPESVLPDTAQRRAGQPVDGITCGGMEYSTLHVHTHLSIFYHGVAGAGSGSGRRCAPSRNERSASTGFTRMRPTASSTSSRPCSRPKAARDSTSACSSTSGVNRSRAMTLRD